MRSLKSRRSDAVVQLWSWYSPVPEHLFSHFFLPEFTAQASRSVRKRGPRGGQRDCGSAERPEPAGGREEGEPQAGRLLLRSPLPGGSRQPRSRRRVPPRAGSSLPPHLPGRRNRLSRGSRGGVSGKNGEAAGGCAAAQRQRALSLPAGGCRPAVCEGRRCGSRTGRRLPGQPVQVDAGDRSLQIPGRCWRGREGAPLDRVSRDTPCIHLSRVMLYTAFIWKSRITSTYSSEC